MLSVYAVNPELDDAEHVANWQRVSVNELLNRPSGGTLTVDRPNRGPGSWWRLLWQPFSLVTITDDDTGHVWTGYPSERTRSSDGAATITLQHAVNLLTLREVTPEPNPSAWSAVTHRTYAGPVIVNLGDLVLDYVGPTAHITQRLAHFEVDTLGEIDADIAIRARAGLTVLDWIHLKGTPAGAVADVRWDGDEHVVRCTIRAAVERPNVVFATELMNVAKWETVERVRTLDEVIVAGAGEGVERLVTVRRLPPEEARTGWTRSTFADRRNLAELAELQAEGDELLASAAASTQIVADLVDTPDNRYGVDFLLGDLVRVSVDDFDGMEPVTEVTTEATNDNGGAMVRRARAGFGPINPHARTAAQVADLGRRVAQIEGAL